MIIFKGQNNERLITLLARIKILNRVQRDVVLSDEWMASGTVPERWSRAQKAKNALCSELGRKASAYMFLEART